MKNIFTFFLLFTITFNFAQDCSEDYRYVNVFNKHDIEKATFNLDIVTSRGGAFVIDKENGYLITAYHVVKANTRKKGKKSISGSNGISDVKFEFEVVETLKDYGYDLALIKVVNLDKWKSEVRAMKIESMDVTFDYQFDTKKCHLSSFNSGLGYKSLITPVVLDGIQKIPLNELNKIHNVFIAHKRTNSGQSGSPLVNENGLVTGILIQSDISNNLSYFVPSIYFQHFIRKINTTNKVKDLINKIENGGISQSDFKRLFDTKYYKDYLRNYEIAQFIEYFLSSTNRVSYLCEWFKCPLFRILDQRRLALYTSKMLNNTAFLKSIAVIFKDYSAKDYLMVKKSLSMLNGYAELELVDNSSNIDDNLFKKDYVEVLAENRVFIDSITKLPNEFNGGYYIQNCMADFGYSDLSIPSTDKSKFNLPYYRFDSSEDATHLIVLNQIFDSRIKNIELKEVKGMNAKRDYNNLSKLLNKAGFSDISKVLKAISKTGKCELNTDCLFVLLTSPELTSLSYETQMNLLNLINDKF